MSARPVQCDAGPGEQPPVCVGAAGDLSQHGRLIVHVPQMDVQIVVVKTRRGVFAFGDSCPHIGVALRAGKVVGTTITCPGHARRYSLRSGRCVSALGSGARLRRWRAWVDDGKVWIGEELT